MRSKLAGYSLNHGHAAGGPKAAGFQSILGITIDAIDYLECHPVRGLGEARARIVVATVKQTIKEHDVIKLARPIGNWPVETVGCVVSDCGDDKLIEIADDKGQMLDLLTVAEDQLHLFHQVQRLSQ